MVFEQALGRASGSRQWCITLWLDYLDDDKVLCGAAEIVEGGTRSGYQGVRLCVVDAGSGRDGMWSVFTGLSSWLLTTVCTVSCPVHRSDEGIRNGANFSLQGLFALVYRLPDLHLDCAPPLLLVREILGFISALLRLGNTVFISQAKRIHITHGDWLCRYMRNCITDSVGGGMRRSVVGGFRGVEGSNEHYQVVHCILVDVVDLWRRKKTIYRHCILFISSGGVGGQRPVVVLQFSKALAYRLPLSLSPT